MNQKTTRTTALMIACLALLVAVAEPASAGPVEELVEYATNPPCQAVVILLHPPFIAIIEECLPQLGQT